MKQYGKKVALVLGLLWTVPAAAGESDEALRQKLMLTSDQQVKYQAILRDYQRALNLSRQEVSDQQKHLTTTYGDAQSASGTVKAALDRWAELKGKKAGLEAGHLWDLYQLLSPHQRKILIEELF